MSEIFDLKKMLRGNKPKTTAEDVKQDIINRAKNRQQEIDFGVSRKDITKLGEILSKVEDVDNDKVDALRLLYSILNEPSADKEKNLIAFLKKAPKVNVKKVIKVTVTK